MRYRILTTPLPFQSSKHTLPVSCRTDTLANQLMVPRHGCRIAQHAWSFFEDLHLADALVLDDFSTTPIDTATAHQLLNILAEREHRRSTIVTSQFTPYE